MPQPGARLALVAEQARRDRAALRLLMGSDLILISPGYTL